MGNNSLKTDLSTQDGQSPWIVERIKNNPTTRRVLMTLWALGVMATTDTNAQNAAWNSLPAAPLPESTETTWAVLTNNEVIALLQANKDQLTQKYPSLKDETIWLKVVGALATGVAKKETIDYLAGAFGPDTDENKRLIAFGSSLVGTSKLGNNPNAGTTAPAPAGVKKPALGSKEAEDAKKLKDKNDKLRKEMLTKINKSISRKDAWKVDAAASGDAEIVNKDGGIGVKFKPKKDKAMQEWYALFNMQLPEGTYNIKLDADGPIIFWVFDANGQQLNLDGSIPENGRNRMSLNLWDNIIQVSPNTARISLGIPVTPLAPQKVVKKITVEEDLKAALANTK